MIRGAVEIFGEIPAVYLNPFLVAESQEEAMRGFIVVAYLPEEDLKRYDLLFLRGPEVYECISLDEVRRARINMDAAHGRFKSYIKQGHTLIYLFEAGESLTQHFISTVYTEPIIKVKVETLSKQQIQRLLRSAGCARPLAERIDFSRKLPSVEIREIDPLSPGLEFHIGFKQGGFFLYDLADMAVRPAATAPVSQAVQTELAFEPIVAARTFQAVCTDVAQLTNGVTSREGVQEPLPGADREPVDEADQERGRCAGRNRDRLSPDRLRRRPDGKKRSQKATRAHQPDVQAAGLQPDAEREVFD